MSEVIDEAELAEFLELLRSGKGSIEIDTNTAFSSPSMRIAEENATRAADANERGIFIASMYTVEHDAKLAPSGYREWVRQCGVNREQTRRLLAAGAKWIGMDHYKP